MGASAFWELLKTLVLLEIITHWGAWVAHLVRCQTLDISSGLNLWDREFKPHVRLHAGCGGYLKKNKSTMVISIIIKVTPYHLYVT